jgi:AcrR family transcriptional regulator
MHLAEITESDTTESRRDALLEAAVSIFARYGFRKTSMDEVARAAGVSRQGLYLQFADKEALFRKAIDFRLNQQLRAAIIALSDPQADLEPRLIAACDEWAGRFVGMLGADAADLICAGTALAGATLSHYEARFEEALAHAVQLSPLASFCTASGFSPPDVAKALHATARGLKQSSKSRQEFVQGITVAARMFCAPLSQRIPH